ncbi:porin [Photobacterium swingsii]|uniref:Porin n=1 Tax=Photobacterium swingsii TaxID=680026 RepID=A0A0J8VDL3_9GAMM|nr:porin [Photobacterium swingsii]KMV31157.1 membrane protein [Photobacterium swingsii]PSW24229.1 porin [Photobacterium swingsii]
MNKNLIALAVAAATLSGAVQAAEVYSDETSSLAIGGRIEARGALKDGNVTDNTRTRVNIGAKSDITDSVYGLGFFEREFRAGTEVAGVKVSPNDENRKLYAGIGSDYGQVVYGKIDGSLGMITDFTDIMAYHGNAAGSKINAADRADNSLAYIGSFDNLVVKANYVFDNGSNKDGYSAGAMYTLDMGLGFGAGYAQQDQGKDITSGKEVDEKQKQAFAAISYTYGDIYVAGLYQDARNTVAEKARGYELAAKYTMDKLVFSGTFNYLENRDANVSEKAVKNEYAVDATYYFTNNFRTYASYKLDQAKTDVAGERNKDEFVLGARYDF